MEINHFSHEEHPLILEELKEEEDKKEVVCYGCRKPVSGSTYCCSKCKAFLHKSCADLPLEFTHPMHYEHPLVLLVKPAYAGGSCLCDICSRSWSGFTYHCSMCEFDVDVSCAQLEIFKHTIDGKHPLILKELQQGDMSSKKVVCCGCEQLIVSGSSTYFCSICEVFLHKTCAELPLEFTHLMHSQHPLLLFVKPAYGAGMSRCDICERSCNGFTYRCSKCDFGVDVFCAQLEIFKHTIKGKHPLTLKELQQGDMSSKKVVCCGCEQLIVSGSSTYFCSICEVFLHKSCAELPLKFTHPMHSEHPLLLFAKPAYGAGMSRCDVCERSCNGFTYRCSECDFDVDVLCAKLEITSKHTIDGNHQLILKELRQEDMSGEKVVCCGVCEQLIVSGSSTYFCSECEVFVHKSCGELQSEIMHPMHSACHHHPLQLCAKSPDGSICNVCDRSCKSGIVYCCFKCEFYLDVLCAQIRGTILKHPSHQHPLKLQQRSALFRCDACGIKEEDESYDCTECSFWIHKSCGSLPSKLSQKCHPHPLLVAYCFPEQYRGYGLKCDICREKLYPNYWVYYCGPCRYFVHIKCMTSYSQEANTAGEIPPNWISLPTEVLSAQLIRHFLEEEGLPVLIEQSKEIINHFSHDHPLILNNIQDDYSEMDDDDQETVCSACIEPISGSCYGCAQCSYFIHLHCADQLPNNLSSSYHPHHQLSLNHCRQEFFGFFKCSCCLWDCNGFFYECKECDLSLDINCALFPPAIKHETHDHFLVRGNYSCKFCNACNSRHWDVFLSCKTCDKYNLAMDCATCPQIVKHRWDKHPLILSFPPFHYHPDEFICDICGKEINSMYWLYHCRECDNSFHLRCIPRLGGDYPKVKFGGKLQIECHPHPLTFVREVKYKLCCDKCGDDLKGRIGFECETCYFNLCQRCVWKICQS